MFFSPSHALRRAVLERSNQTLALGLWDVEVRACFPRDSVPRWEAQHHLLPGRKVRWPHRRRAHRLPGAQCIVPCERSHVALARIGAGGLPWRARHTPCGRHARKGLFHTGQEAKLIESRENSQF